MAPHADEEMFQWAEKQRNLAKSMSSEALACALLDDVMRSVAAARSELSTDDGEAYDRLCGVLREAAFRLADVRQYE